MDTFWTMGHIADRHTDFYRANGALRSLYRIHVLSERKRLAAALFGGVLATGLTIHFGGHSFVASASCFSGGPGVQTSSFPLASPAEELIHRKKIILSCSGIEYSARSRCERVCGGRALGTLIAQEVAVREAFRSPQYLCVHH